MPSSQISWVVYLTLSKILLTLHKASNKAKNRMQKAEYEKVSIYNEYSSLNRLEKS